MTVQRSGSWLFSPGWGHLATSGTLLVISMGGGEVLTGASGVEAGDAANLPVMHCTTPSHRITQPKMSTVPNERNFDPKRRSQITWRDQSQCISLLRKHANKWYIHQWWSRQHDLLIFYSFLPRHHHVGKAEVQCEGENEKLANLRFFFLTSSHDCTEILYRPSAFSASTSCHLMLETEMILPSECKHFPKTGTLRVLEGRRL